MSPIKDSPEWRKQRPLWSGVMRYFPKALLEVAHVSWVGNEQHNPGTEVHWDRSKSGDEGDACARHLAEAGTRDSDGTRHSAKAAWRALALLEKEMEAEEPVSAPFMWNIDADAPLPPNTEFIAASGWHVEKGCRCEGCRRERRNR